MYGIKDPRKLSNHEISIKAEKLGIPSNLSYTLKPIYFKALIQGDTTKPYGISVSGGKSCGPLNDYMQPLQLMYFDSAGKLISFHINCYATGFPKLHWNNKGQFDQFIPASSVPLTENVVTRQFVLSYLDPVDGYSNYPANKNIAILFWSDFMYKQSKELIRVANENLKLDRTHNTAILYVNVDNNYTDTALSKNIKADN